MSLLVTYGILVGLGSVVMLVSINYSLSLSLVTEGFSCLLKLQGYLAGCWPFYPKLDLSTGVPRS
jgi:hypothetical protein